MKARYLEVTFRKGRPVAAYLYLPRSSGTKATRTEVLEPGVQVDFSADGQPIGFELTNPEYVRVEVINQVLVRFGIAEINEIELKPLRAA